MNIKYIAGIKNKKDGFTLIEIIVASVILIIIAALIINVIMTGMLNVNRFGESNIAMTNASGIIEHLYSLQPLTLAKIKLEVENISDAVFVASEDDLKAYTGHDINYTVSDFPDTVNKKGYKIVLTVFYNRGESSVSVSSFLRRSD